MFETNPVFRGRKQKDKPSQPMTLPCCLKLTPFSGDGNKFRTNFFIKHNAFCLKLTPFSGDGN